MVHTIIPGDLIIKAGVTVTVQNRCRGLHIQVMGNCFLYGTIDMSNRGCYAASPPNVGLEFFHDRNRISENDANWASLPSCRKIAAIGAAAVIGYHYKNSNVILEYGPGAPGNAGINGSGGSGGAGSTVSNKTPSYGYVYSHYSGAGSSVGGGPGSGGVNASDPGQFGLPAENYGGVEIGRAHV